jgi:uncharacterized membrane protein YkvI
MSTAAAATPAGRASRFQRYLLPGLAFKSVVIGGGYATGRELVEFFMPHGPLGGAWGMVLAMAVWSVVCALTFAFAQAMSAHDYRGFFQNLLGPIWRVFELAYLVLMVLLLAVFGAAAGAIVAAASGWPPLVGTLLLMAGIGVFAAFGNDLVERLFKWHSFVLYAVYALFVAFAVHAFGPRIADGFEQTVPAGDWAAGGLTYAAYNLVCVAIILPTTRHFTGRRDAVIAGALAGPLAMLPALLFFACMVAWYPQINTAVLPSEFMLERMGRPLFHLLFQTMVFFALLESGVGAVHAVNERVAASWRERRGVDLPVSARSAIAAVLLVGSIFIAERFGLVALIANGYRALAWLFLAVFVLPLVTVGVWKLWHVRPSAADAT